MEVFQEIKNKLITNQWIESKGKGNGAVGITLESLLNKETENFEIPDYKGVELKAKCSKRYGSITLFSAVPDSYLFQIERLVEQYGYPDNDFPQFKVLNTAVYGHRKIKINQNYFKLHVDWRKKTVTLQIYNSKNPQILDELSSWSFEMLQEKLERKLNKLALVHADRKYINQKVYFKYNDIKFYQLSSFENFLKLIEHGYIYIIIKIGVYKDERRFGKIYNHGCSFCINDQDITKLFNRVLV